MKTRRALVILSALVVALALSPSSRADFGYTASATSASGITLGGDVTGAASANTVSAISGTTPIIWSPNELRFVAGAAPLLDQASESTATKAADWVWTPQTSTHTTDQGGGSADVGLQVPTGAGVEAYLQVFRGPVATAANTRVQLGAWVGLTTYGAIYLGEGATAPATTNVALAGNGSTTILNGASAVNVDVGSGTIAQVGSSFIAFAQPLGGYSTTPFAFSSTAGAIACGTGGTQTISAAQSITPGLTVTSGTLGSNCVLDFSTNAPTGHFELDMSGVTLGASFGVTFKNGTATKTYTTAGVVAGTLAIVYTHGANTLAVNY